ncbi:hypothetical protein [Sphingobacterium hotanense]|uniref:hypothetical protein n=1 Tax=Sphingobacterium hotanense TaxID=649196 RepID=UPI0021A33D0F|nr:hypothetical protein [Sphingobacterium hotanense]MCT1526565.1 hypothetical protein [Sphingobacterium hotanense]
MDDLLQLIDLLNNQDKADFKSFLNRKNKRKDVKNIRLFNFLETDDIKSINKLYSGQKNKDAYHALRKRLQDNVLQFLSQRAFESKDSAVYEILRNLVVARFLLENSAAKIGLKCLDRAERLAVQEEQFGLVNEVFLLRMQYAHLDSELALDRLLDRFTLNQTHMQREAKMHMAYAYLRRELQEIHLKGKIVNLTELIEATLKKYQIAVLDLMNYKSLYQILYIANEYAAINQNYGLIERYVRKTYQYIQGLEKPKERHLYYHLYILYYLANFNLRNKRFAESISYLTQMDELMDSSKSYREQFMLRYQLLLGLNYHFSGKPQEGIQAIEEGLSYATKKSSQEDIDDLYLSLTMFYAQHRDSRSLSYLAKLGHTDHWYEKKMGMLWTIRKNLMEILVHLQFENTELAVSRLHSFKRRYKKYLLSIQEERVMAFLSMVERSIQKPDIVSEQTYQDAVSSMVDIDANKDIFNLSFIAWLMAKWEKKTAYQLTLSLIETV